MYGQRQKEGAPAVRSRQLSASSARDDETHTVGRGARHDNYGKTGTRQQESTDTSRGRVRDGRRSCQRRVRSDCGGSLIQAGRGSGGGHGQRAYAYEFEAAGAALRPAAFVRSSPRSRVQAMRTFVTSRMTKGFGRCITGVFCASANRLSGRRTAGSAERSAVR
jgi:hypothetical protein